jgi:organic radical activating enzyme
MKYFLLPITMKCNKSCSYCIVKDYINNPKYPDKIVFSELAAFLDEHMDDGDFCEITGGEPTAWEHLPELLDYLESRNCYILVRTNGFKPTDLSKYARLYIYLAQHGESDEWAWETFNKFNCNGLISNKDNLPVMVKDNYTAEAKIIEEELAQFTDTYFITNDSKIRFMPCDNIFRGTLKDGLNSYNFQCNNRCPFKQGAWEVLKRIDNASSRT